MGRGVGDHRARLLKPAFAKWKRGCGGAVRRPILPPRSAWLSRPAARADRPDRDQRVAVDDMNMVVEIDRREIGRAHVFTPVTNVTLVCRLLIATKNYNIEA